MLLIVILDLLAVGVLCWIAMSRGLERALPAAAFLLIIFPNESQIQLPGLFDLTTQRVVILALIALYLMKGGDTNRKASLPLKYSAVLLIAWMLVASANSVVPVVSMKATFSRLFDSLVPFYIYAKTVSKAETVHKILFGFVAAMFVCSIFGAVEAYAGWSVLTFFPHLPSRFSYLDGGAVDRGMRVQATFGHAILFGAALAMAIPVAIYLLSDAKHNGQKLFLWAAMLFMFLSLYKTESRGPWIAALISLAILLVLGRGLLRRYVMIVVMLSVIVLVVRPGVWGTISNLYGETMNPDTAQGQSYQWRYALYQIAERELSKSFGRSLWGYGPESFYFLGLTTRFAVDGEEHTVKVESCDSAVVELMMDTGYVGFLIAAFMLVKAAYISFRNYLKLPSLAGRLCLVLFVNICAFCFLMTNVELYGWGQQSYMLWIILAMTMTYANIFRAESTHMAWKPKAGCASTPCLVEVPMSVSRLLP